MNQPPNVIEQLKTLRDEIRVDLHLAKMEAKERWERSLEPRVFQLQANAQRARAVSKEIIQEAIRDLEQFRDELRMTRR